MTKILITGAKVFAEDRPNLHYIWGDLRNSETLKEIPDGIEAAYYLVHSMSEIVGYTHNNSMVYNSNIII